MWLRRLLVPWALCLCLLHAAWAQGNPTDFARFLEKTESDDAQFRQSVAAGVQTNVDLQRKQEDLLSQAAALQQNMVRLKNEFELVKGKRQKDQSDLEQAKRKLLDAQREMNHAQEELQLSEGSSNNIREQLKRGVSQLKGLAGQRAQIAQQIAQNNLKAAQEAAKVAKEFSHMAESYDNFASSFDQLLQGSSSTTQSVALDSSSVGMSDFGLTDNSGSNQLRFSK
eukprot:GILJ01000345.1.p1 GENE.GILJ01000345.1~~GILJ01000345.1.p1  ORF type:complete len:226 (-),score=44.09 GILJ01000345.1:138-815(-)